MRQELKVQITEAQELLVTAIESDNPYECGLPRSACLPANSRRAAAHRRSRLTLPVASPDSTGR